MPSPPPSNRTDVPEKTLGDRVFSFSDLDSAWPNYKITLFSSRGKTKSLNLFFSVINNMDYEKVIANKSPTHLTTWKFFVVFIRPRNGTISSAR